MILREEVDATRRNVKNSQRVKKISPDRNGFWISCPVREDPRLCHPALPKLSRLFGSLVYRIFHGSFVVPELGKHGVR